MIQGKPTILIIFGATGDLANRYILPAVEAIRKAGMLPEKFEIVSITRKPDPRLYQMDVEKLEEYEKLNAHLMKMEEKWGAPAERIFHLSVPPSACKNIVEFLGQSSLVRADSKILLEKPFGYDLENARDLINHINKYFRPEQVYRTDHYMAKEAAQNLIVFRDRNSLFKKTWNKDFIESIDIVVMEKLDIEGRVHFYEQTGALRDVVQSHLLQLAALTLMEIPANLEDVPKFREKALQDLSVVCDISESECVKRAQYEGYRREVRNENSMIETFVSINLRSSNPSWSGVPITLTAGKALSERLTEIKIRYKKEKDHESNELLLRIQPEPGIWFSIWSKVPGYEYKVSEQALHFSFLEHSTPLPDAYEQVLFSAINSDHSFFTSSGEILESWRILDAIQKAWIATGTDMIFYKKGSSLPEVLKLFS